MLEERAEQHPASLLRFVTCGSVDDGKSTLIGRLLWESNVVPDDQVSALESDSLKWGTQGGALDLALLVDGLESEREQGITIDVAYRFFSTARRRFVVADSPGHEQYTSNMATAASTADAAVILIDARKGMLVQTRRHSRILALLGVKHVAVAINKMDLAGWDAQTFARIRGEYTAFAESLQFDSVQFIPLSALTGDNVVTRSAMSPWHDGPTLVHWLESVDARTDAGDAFRMPVQMVSRPNPEFRGFCGTIVAGAVRPGDRVRISPSGLESTVSAIVTMDGNLAEARHGQAVTLTMSDEIDIGRGDVIAAAGAPVQAADHFRVNLLWMGSHAMVPGRRYGAKLHSRVTGATVTEIVCRIDVNSGARLAARTVARNEIAEVSVNFEAPVPFEPYATSRALGALVLTDTITGETVGAGMIRFALRRSANVQWQSLEITRSARESLKGQRARCFWFTGLSGAGKSTTADLLDRRLHIAGRHTYVLDGDNVRHGLNRDLGFAEPDRVENIRRIAEVARLMVDAGLIVIVSAISPYRSDRAFARSLFADGDFVEVFVDTPLAVCEQRDTKGLYAKARAGFVTNLTGIGSPYEAPVNPEVRIVTTATPAAHAAELLAEMALEGAMV